MYITDENVDEVKEILELDKSCKIGPDQWVGTNADSRFECVFKEWAILKDMRTVIPFPPKPDGTRSSPSFKANIYAADKAILGFIVWTRETPELWVVLY